MRENQAPWRLWGPYLSERQWGTVREDYSPDGAAWEYFTHDMARSRAYRWGEDGLGGISDIEQRLCLALALWNERDSVLKERLFGLTNPEGNHGEDVKELYYYLDATPTHSYLKMLYKYPQRAFPYDQLLAENRRRGLHDGEFEIMDTGVFDDDRYFDVLIEYAKAEPEDLLLRVTVYNRGEEAAPIHVLPHLWFRNTWSWGRESTRPELYSPAAGTLEARHVDLGAYWLYYDAAAELLLCENETNAPRLFGTANGQGYYKDGINDYVVHKRVEAVNPQRTGTKAAIHYETVVPGSGQQKYRLRLTRRKGLGDPFSGFDTLIELRRTEADAYYSDLQQGITDEESRVVQRQALAGMIWNKQFYYYDVPQWLEGDPGQPTPPPQRLGGRNSDWEHLNNADIISMPDTWEYPWYAAWDLAFHMIPFALIDAEFAKSQLVLLGREWYMHPNGQIPAYEWAFGDVNPPVQAWAAWRVFQIDRKQHGGPGDLPFLERVFHKLLLNFTWWVNRRDRQGRNVFQGGFLGLDNIGVFDRSKPLPTGGYIDQSDATSWMGMYCLNLMRISLELARHNAVYEDIATKFFEHFLHIAEAMTNIGGEGIGLWDEQDEFYYDVLHLPNGPSVPLKVRSAVGLIPLFAVETIEPEMLEAAPEFARRLEWFLNYRPDLAQLVSHWTVPGRGKRCLLSLLRGHRMKCLLRRMLDESEFLSDCGVRSLSRRHSTHPYSFWTGEDELLVTYQPAESTSRAFGGNSNWRGPIWLPINYLIIESLEKFHHYYGDEFKIECPTGSGHYTTINGVAQELTRRLTRLFLADNQGRRAVFGADEKLQQDPCFRNCLLFHEYFDGDTGRGLGASHQTGWTGLIAKLLHPKREPVH